MYRILYIYGSVCVCGGGCCLKAPLGLWAPGSQDVIATGKRRPILGQA